MSVFWTIVLGLLLLRVTLTPREAVPFGKDETLPLRGLAMVIIVLGHLYVRSPLGGIFLGDVLRMEGAVGVFFFLSGYGLILQYEKRGVAYLNGFFVRSTLKLILPLLILAIAWQTYRLLAVGRCWYIGDMIATGATPLPNSWYIFELYALYLLFGVAMWLFGSFGVHVTVALSIVLTGALILAPRWGCQWWTATLAFPAGILFAKYRALVYRNKEAVALAMLVALTGAAVASGVFRESSYAYNFFRIAWNGLLGCACGIVLTWFPFKLPLFSAIGRISFELYLIHGCFVIGLLLLSSNVALYWCLVVVLSVIGALIYRFVHARVRIAWGRIRSQIR